MSNSHKMETIIESLDQAKSFESLNEVVSSLADVYEVEHSVYHSLDQSGESYAICTYSPEWLEHYVAENFMAVDPVVKTAFQRFHPYNWKSLDWTSKTARMIFHEAVDVGIGSQGFSLPVRGPSGEFALFSLNKTTSDEAWAKFTQDNVSDLLLLGHYIHQAVRRIDHKTGQEPLVTLSPREADALRYLALGLNRARVAETLGISEHTLRVYIESARFKLGAANTVHAVAKALMSGAIAI